MIRAFGFASVLMLGLMACSSAQPTVLFPAPGALLVNPVRLETTEAVTWSVDGRTVGSGRT